VPVPGIPVLRSLQTESATIEESGTPTMPLIVPQLERHLFKAADILLTGRVRVPQLLGGIAP
jgi:hypothetical protein